MQKLATDMRVDQLPEYSRPLLWCSLLFLRINMFEAATHTEAPNNPSHEELCYGRQRTTED